MDCTEDFACSQLRFSMEQNEQTAFKACIVFNVVMLETGLDRVYRDLTPFFSQLLTCEVNLIEFLEIMAQMEPYIIFLSLKPTEMNSDFIFNYLKKVTTQSHHSKIEKTNRKTLISSRWMRPKGPRGCQKKRHYPSYKLMEGQCAKIEPKMQKINKNCQKT